MNTTIPVPQQNRSAARYTWKGMLLAVLLTAALVGGGIFWYEESRYQVIIDDMEAASLAAIDEMKTSSLEAIDELAETVTTDPDTTTAIPTLGDVTADLTTALAAKFDASASSLDVTVSDYTATRASGTVGFGEETGGGWFLAAVEDGEWIIVDSGNGTVDCALIEPYNFSTDMVPECYDSTTEESVTR